MFDRQGQKTYFLADLRCAVSVPLLLVIQDAGEQLDCFGLFQRVEDYRGGQLVPAGGTSTCDEEVSTTTGTLNDRADMLLVIDVVQYYQPIPVSGKPQQRPLTQLVGTQLHAFEGGMKSDCEIREARIHRDS
ncbi:hypothetical protein AAW14_33850 [Streptomyces hygroscopicus]|nr:hypothetical protein [Streptomyces hygroscopicus]